MDKDESVEDQAMRELLEELIKDLNFHTFWAFKEKEKGCN